MGSRDGVTSCPSRGTFDTVCGQDGARATLPLPPIHQGRLTSFLRANLSSSSSFPFPFQSLRAGGSSALAAGQEERPAGRLCGAAAPACLALASPGSGPPKTPARAPGGLRAPRTLPAPCLGLVPLLLVPQETHIILKEITALALPAPHGAPPAPPVSPWLILGAKSSAAAPCWERSSDTDAPCATTIPVVLGHIPG